MARVTNDDRSLTDQQMEDIHEHYGISVTFAPHSGRSTLNIVCPSCLGVSATSVRCASERDASFLVGALVIVLDKAARGEK